MLAVEEEVLSSSSIGIWCGGVGKVDGIGVVSSFGTEIITSSFSEVGGGMVVAGGGWPSGWELETVLPKS